MSHNIFATDFPKFILTAETHFKVVYRKLLLSILDYTEETLVVKIIYGASKTVEALGNCSLAFHPQKQAIHSLNFNPLQQRVFSL